MDFTKKKYVFLDIDGTLTDSATKRIVPSAQRMLDRLQETGCFIAIAIGRAHYKAKGFTETSGLRSMVCCGGSGLATSDKLIMSTSSDRQKATAAYKEARALDYGALVVLDDSIDVYDMGDRFSRQCGEWKEPTNYMSRTDSDADQVKDIYKLYTSVPKEGEHRLTKKDTLGDLRFVEAYLMFQHDRKKEGILDMMERLDSSVKGVVIFGDDYNDLVMFDDVWFSIAMGNVCGVLKKKVDYVTECNVDGDIYKACLKFGWVLQDFDLPSSIKKKHFICYRFLIDLDSFRQEIQRFYQWKLNLLCPQTP